MTTPTPSAPTLEAGRRRRLTLLALCLAGFVIQLDVTIVNVALPSVQHQLHAAAGALEWVVSGYTLGLAALIPLAGALGDRLGHRPVLLAALAIFGTFSAAAALAPDPAALVGARIAQGLGGAGILALTLAVLTDTYPPEHRGHAIGWWAAIGGVGFGAGPILGGLLLSAGGWASVFWVNVPIVLVTVVLIVLTVPRAAPTSGARALDVRGVVLASVGLAAVTFALTTTTEARWVPARTLVPLLGGGLALAAFVRRQRRAEDPLIPRAVRRDPAFLGACAIYFTSYLAFGGMLFYVTLMFQNLLGWSALETGLSWALMNLPFLCAAQMSGRLGRRITARAIVTTGCAAGALGVAALSTLSSTSPFVVAAIGYVVAGVGFGLLVPGVTHVAMRDIAGPVAGAASAVLNSSRQLGTAVGLALVGAVGAAATRRSWTGSRSGSTHRDSAVVATGDLHGVPPPLRDAARSAFETGYHVALGVCVASLVLAVVISLRALRRPTPPTGTLRVRETAR